MGLLVCNRRHRRPPLLQGRHILFSFPSPSVIVPARARRSLSAQQFMHSHVPPISPPPPLSYLSRSKSTPSPYLSLPLSRSPPRRSLSRVFETVSFLRRELFSFLGVTRNRSRVTDGGGGRGGGAGGAAVAVTAGEASSPRSSRSGGRIWC